MGFVKVDEPGEALTVSCHNGVFDSVFGFVFLGRDVASIGNVFDPERRF